MSITRTILKTVCVLSSVIAVCAGSFAVIAPAFADDDEHASDTVTPTELTDATLRWGINDETNSAAFYGGCNFLSAGVAADTGASQVWDESFYKATDGNVSIQKPDADGQWTTASWQTKCLTRDGSKVTMAKRADGRSINSESQVVISNGTGTVNADGSTTISWQGSWTVVFYGGMTYWSLTDPTLTLDADGNGALTATASGYGASMEDSSKWIPLTPREIHVADFSGNNAVQVTQALADHGFTATPDYLGIAVDANGDHGSQADKDSTNEAYWGSFPQSFVDFQMETGQSAYWYTSNSSRDFAKPTLPLSVQYDDSYQVSAGEGSPEVTTPTGGATSSNTSTGTTNANSEAVKKTAAAQQPSTTHTAPNSENKNTGENTSAPTSDSADSGTGSDANSVISADATDNAPMLIADNATTIAVGSGSVAVASALPLGFGWALRRKLGLSAAVELDKRLGL